MEYVMNILVRWQSNDDGSRTLLGVTPVTQNDDGSEPQPLFIPVSKLNQVAPQLVRNLQTGVLPVLIQARDAQRAVLMSPEQAAAKALETLSAELVAKQAQLDAINAAIAAKS